MNISEIVTAINLVYVDKPVLKDLCLAQAILESRLMGTPSVLATEGKNLFGIKWNGESDQDHIELPTREFIDGKMVTLEAKFAKFNDWKDSITWHRHLMMRPRYAPVWNAKTFEDACYEIYKCGYATDPQYQRYLIQCFYNYKKSISK